ncbi:hypothetical protein OKE_03168 [Enterococcus faecium EnGen0043]|nr:hypothetical protein OKE_03168 [Enterococcus faecium EnGen0043]
MARKKTITREQILAAAYEVAATDGFTRFTARNIANKMNCSTQPIYLEFKNMDDLRQALLSRSMIIYNMKCSLLSIQGIRLSILLLIISILQEERRSCIVHCT